MSSASLPPTLSNDQRREQLRSAVEVECGTAISSEATDEEVEARARETLARLVSTAPPPNRDAAANACSRMSSCA